MPGFLRPAPAVFRRPVEAAAPSGVAGSGHRGGADNLWRIRAMPGGDSLISSARVGIDFGFRPAHVKRAMIRVHGTSVALDGGGVLLRGPSGSGKSDLALRLIDGGARLVADDQTELHACEHGVSMSSPPAIAGQMEVRGLGIVPVPTVASALLRLVVDLVPTEAVERLPEQCTCTLLGQAIPLLRLAGLEASAPAKLRLALRSLRLPDGTSPAGAGYPVAP